MLLATIVRLPTLSQQLLEHHGLRQTQTAYTAVIFHEQGVNLLHPQLPVFGAPFEVPFEFPLFQALAAGVMSWGVPADAAMRTTALACFLLRALLLWGLVRHVGGRVAAMVTLAIFLFSPFSLLGRGRPSSSTCPSPAPWAGCGPGYCGGSAADWCSPPQPWRAGSSSCW